MNVCTKCGSRDIELKLHSEYQYNQFGISAVLHCAVIQPTCKKCGHSYHVIPNPEGLDVAIALARILIPIKLNVAELKFIRKAMGLKASEFAKRMEMTSENYSRLENGHLPLNEKTEKFFRMNVAAELEEKAPAIDFEQKEIAKMKLTPFRSEEPRIELRAVFFKDSKIEEEAWSKYRLKAAS